MILSQDPHKISEGPIQVLRGLGWGLEEFIFKAPGVLTSSYLETSRADSSSHLSPTIMNTGFVSSTLLNDCKKASSRSKVARDAIEYSIGMEVRAARLLQGWFGTWKRTK